MKSLTGWTDVGLVRKICQGTRRHPDQYQILHNDGRRALVLTRGHYIRTAGGQRFWLPGWVEMINLEKPRFVRGVLRGRSVWDCSRKRHGRLTNRKLRALVQELFG